MKHLVSFFYHKIRKNVKMRIENGEMPFYFMILTVIHKNFSKSQLTFFVTSFNNPGALKVNEGDEPNGRTA